MCSCYNEFTTIDPTTNGEETTEPTSVTYKIDLYYNGQINESIFVEEGETLSVSNPVLEGHRFDGWYLEYDLKTKYENTPILGNMTLYAKFVKQYKISFVNTNITDILVDEGSILKDIVVDNESFLGWEYYTNQNNDLDYNMEIDSDLVLFPIVIKENYTINFYSDDVLYETSKVVEGQCLSKPKDPYKEGYRFDGWYVNTVDEIKYDFNSIVVGSFDLYAYWNKVHTISFDLNYDSIKIITGEKFSLPVAYKDGYEFVGWFADGILFTEDTEVIADVSLTAKFEKIEISDIDINVTSYSGYNEGAYVEFDKILGYQSKNNYNVYYKKVNTSDYILVDKELLQENETSFRCDILGLSSGYYDLKITFLEFEKVISDVLVSAYDRSGYAHFNTSEALGGYNNDGTVKDDAIIVYVTEETKNTVTCSLGGKTYTGICNILKNQSKSSKPLIVRIIGTITAATWNRIEYNGDPLALGGIKDSSGKIVTSSLTEEEIISRGINSLNIYDGVSKLNGLTNRLKYSSSEYDSYYNMLDISNAEYVTVEGVGVNAGLFQWGFTWKNCSYIEVRNLTFDDYTEDACSFEGSKTSASSFSDFDTGHIWIHHNTFNEGINYWDVTSEQDKHDGDGATDLKGNIYTTISYNHYYKNHKTGLVGGGDSVTTACVTFHHNFYDQCASRLPLGRQANMHMYNNYYYKSSGTNMSIRAGGYAFIENCVFESCNNPMQTKAGAGLNAVIKSYNNIVNNCKGDNNANVVSNRWDFILNDNIFNKSFDTDPEWFYYDSVNFKTDVSVMHDVSLVAQYCKNNAGVLKGDFVSSDPSLEEGEKTYITVADFSVGNISSTTTVNGLTIIPKTDKTCKVSETKQTLAGYTVTKYINFGGGGDFNSLSLRFTLEKNANITVYYASGGSSVRYAKLSNDDTSFTATTPTIVGSANSIVSYTFNDISAGEWAISSSGSGIDIYLLIIEYIE